MKNKILLIDDEAEIRRLLERALTQRGYRVFAAASGTEAKCIAKENAPDLIICDLQMEDTDGLLLIEELKESAPDTPIMLLTGVFFDPETIRETISKKVSVYVNKTEPLGQIMKEVDRLCRS